MHTHALVSFCGFSPEWSPNRFLVVIIICCPHLCSWNHFWKPMCLLTFNGAYTQRERETEKERRLRFLFHNRSYRFELPKKPLSFDTIKETVFLLLFYVYGMVLCCVFNRLFILPSPSKISMVWLQKESWIKLNTSYWMAVSRTAERRVTEMMLMLVLVWLLLRDDWSSTQIFLLNLYAFR